eukprot:gene18396-biopygen879
MPCVPEAPPPGLLGHTFCSSRADFKTAPPRKYHREKRLRMHPGRVRFFNFDRAGRVRDASAARSPSNSSTGDAPNGRAMHAPRSVPPLRSALR